MKDILFGAIIGDMCGSSYERSFNKDMELDKIELITPEMHFTDDTVCSIAIADAIIKDVDNPNFEESLIKWCDTIAAMAGSIAYADYWYVPAYLIEAAKNNLPDEMLEVVDAFDDFVTYEEW